MGAITVGAIGENMAELYELQLVNGSLVFANGVESVPGWALNLRFNPAKAEPGVTLDCRMGDPVLLHCVVFRKNNQPGGIFSLFFGRDPLYAAHAATNLVFAAGLGYFGELTANCRYGVDVFENMELPDE